MSHTVELEPKQSCAAGDNETAEEAKHTAPRNVPAAELSHNCTPTVCHDALSVKFKFTSKTQSYIEK